MCKKCGYKNGDTYHLLYWQAEWFKRFITAWWHIVNRKAYWKWCAKNRLSIIKNNKINIDEGFRFEFDDLIEALFH